MLKCININIYVCWQGEERAGLGRKNTQCCIVFWMFVSKISNIKYEILSHIQYSYLNSCVTFKCRIYLHVNVNGIIRFPNPMTINFL